MFYRVTTYTRLGEAWEVQDFSDPDAAIVHAEAPCALTGGWKGFAILQCL